MSSPHRDADANGPWIDLGASGLRARAIRTGLADIAFWKHLYESYEEVAIVRVAVRAGQEAVVAIIAPPDQQAEAEAILSDVRRRGAPRSDDAELPVRCREDWFLAEWARDETPQGSS